MLNNLFNLNEINKIWSNIINEKIKENNLNKKICIITICDKNYVNHFDLFLKSFSINENNNKVYLEHFYIYSSKKEINEFNNKYKKKKFNVNFNFVKFDENYYQKKIFLDLHNKPSKYNLSKKYYCCHYRFKAMQKIIELNNYEYILYLDVDSYINKSIYDSVLEIKESFGMFHRNNINKNNCENKTNYQIKNSKDLNKIQLIGGRPYSRILAGVIFCRCDTIGIKIIKLINKMMEILNLKKNISWYSDQEILDYLFYYFIGKIKIKILSTKFLDLNCIENNNIFFCKGITASSDRLIWKNLINDIEKKITF